MKPPLSTCFPLPCTYASWQGNLQIDSGYIDVADVVIANNGVTVTEGDLVITTGDATIAMGDLTLDAG